MFVMERMVQMPAEERRAMGLEGRGKMASEFDERLVHRAYLDALEKFGIVAG